jgi:hypothetical protein
MRFPMIQRTAAKLAHAGAKKIVKKRPFINYFNELLFFEGNQIGFSYNEKGFALDDPIQAVSTS